jgi:ABC-type polysaccharide/polyol phosphate export permease
MLAELWPRRELILSLVRRDLKTRYRSSILGFLWSFCKPLLLMLVLWLVFSKFVPIQLNMRVPFALFLLCNVLVWNYLAGSLAEAMSSILANTALVKKTYIPHEAFPIVSVLSNLFHFALALIVYSVLFLSYCAFTYSDVGALPTWHVVFLPLVIAIHTFLIVGLAMLLAALNVFYRDVASIMEVLLTAWFYFSPVLYPVTEPLRRIGDSEKMPDWLFHLFMLNPMAPILAAYRKVLLLPAFGDVEMPMRQLVPYLGLALVTSAVLFVLGRAAFRHYAGRFADEV